MERKVSRRGPRQDQPPLDKTMIGMPTNFSHVGHSYPPRDRFGECEVAEVGGGSLEDCPAEVRRLQSKALFLCPPECKVSQDGVQGMDTEGEGEGEEYETFPQPPLSPNSSRRNSRRISKDMISLPTNFRHVLHIDPSTSDPAHLSQLLKGNTDLEYDLEYEEEDDHDDPAWTSQELPGDPQEPSKDLPEPPKIAKPYRPSGRVRKGMISLPTNFQHVSHISAGERITAPESPPPDLPPEPGSGEERKQKTIWGYNEQTTTPSTPSTTPYTTASTPYTDSNASYTPHIPTTHTHTSPLTLPPTETSHPPAPLSAPPHLETTRGKSRLSGGGRSEDDARFRSDETDFDFDIVQFRVPPPPDQNGSDFIRASHVYHPRTYHEQLMEEEAGKEKEKEEAAKIWRHDGRGLTWRDKCQEEGRAVSPLDAPPPLPFLPPAAARKKNIGRPTNFQHLKHLDAQAADRLLLDDYLEERAAKDSEKRKGREREREREGVKERRTPSLPPSLPHIPPPHEPPPPGKLRKAMIGHPTNFQHVAHVGFGGMESGH